VGTVVSDLIPALRGHAVQVDVPQLLPPADIDATLISRVVTNLLENAIRHAPKGTPITIAARPIPAGAITVCVTDQGAGVSPERREGIFGLLARRDSDAGAGIGLSIARTFVEAHGQRIWVDDAPDGGARFWFTLPTAQLIPEEPPRGAGARH